MRANLAHIGTRYGNKITKANYESILACRRNGVIVKPEQLLELNSGCMDNDDDDKFVKTYWIEYRMWQRLPKISENIYWEEQYDIVPGTP